MNGDIVMIAVNDMKVDYSYQRPLDMKRVENLANNWDDAKANLIHVSLRHDGFYVIDGNHTRTAYEMAGGDVLPCRIHENLTIQDEAKLFYELNSTHKNPKFIEMLKARAEAGCEKEKNYIHCMDMSGLPYSLQQGTGKIRCHAALFTIYKMTTDTIMLRALRTAWDAADGRTEFYQTGFFPGLVSLVVLHTNVNDIRLITKVKKVTSSQVNEAASHYKRSSTGGTYTATNSFRKGYIRIYNENLKANKIVEDD